MLFFLLLSSSNERLRLDFGGPGQLMFAIHRAGGRKIFGMVQARYGDIDPSRLLVALPTQRSPADTTEFAYHARRGSEFSRPPLRVLELVRCNKEPCDRLGSG